MRERPDLKITNKMCRSRSIEKGFLSKKKMENNKKKNLTYEAPALIQVISAEFIFKSLPIDAVTPTMHP